ncbi:MAG: hypothetical protein OEZ36_06130 [Spirochaetota bacterium]|nr:hypothetical protein [Spirochaetota bacterium]
MIGMTDLVINSTSRMLLEELANSYRTNSVIENVEKDQNSFTLSFPTNIHNEEKEGIFETVVEKILHLKDPQDKIMETKISVVYLQQANKEYFFSKGELVRYRGFLDSDNPIPMVTKLLLNVHQ